MLSIAEQYTFDKGRVKRKSESNMDSMCMGQDEALNHPLNRSTLETDSKFTTKRRDQLFSGGGNRRALMSTAKAFNEIVVPRRPRSSQGGVFRQSAPKSANCARKVKRHKGIGKLVCIST